MCNSVVFSLFLELCNHQHNFKTISSPQKGIPYLLSVTPISFQSFSPQLKQLLIYVLSLWTHSFYIFHINELMQMWSFTEQKVFKFHPCSMYQVHFFIAEYHFILWIYYILFISFWTFGFPLFGYYEYADMNISELIIVYSYVFISFGYKPESGIAGSCSNFV